MNSHRLRAYYILLVATIIWGVASTVIKYTLSEIEPFSFLAYRFFVSAAVSCIYFLLRPRELVKLKLAKTLIFVNGFFSTTLALGLLFVGLSYTTVLDTSIIQTIAPILTSILAAITLKERITRKEELGTFIAFVGTLVTVVGPVADDFGRSLGGGHMLGNLLVFFFVFTDALSFVFAKIIVRKGISPVTVANASFVVGFFTTLPLLILFPERNFFDALGDLSIRGHIGVWYMALISGTLAYALWNKAQKSIEVSEASLFRYLIPFVAAPLAVLWLGEEISLHFVVGAAIVGVGVFTAEFKRSSKVTVK